MAVAATLDSNILVIEVGRNPAGGTVTVIALRRGRQVIQVLAHGGDAVMATAAGAQHLEVVHGYHGIPQVGRVTVLADIGSCDMIERLTGGRHTIVAVTTALSSNILVIEVGR